MQRADDLDIQGCRLFKKALHLRAVFTDYTDIVASCLASPVLLYVKCAEFTKSVSRKEHLVLYVVRNHDLGPVYHGRENERKHVSAKRERIPLCNYDASVLKISSKEILHHGKCLRRRNDRCLGIYLEKIENIGGVVGLHVLNYKVVGRSATQRLGYIVKPLVRKSGVNRIHNSDLFVNYRVGIVRHSVRNNVLSLKQIYLMIVNSNVLNALCNVHFKTSKCIYYIIFQKI